MYKKEIDQFNNEAKKGEYTATTETSNTQEFVTKRNSICSSDSTRSLFSEVSASSINAEKDAKNVILDSSARIPDNVTGDMFYSSDRYDFDAIYNEAITHILNIMRNIEGLITKEAQSDRYRSTSKIEIDGKSCSIPHRAKDIYSRIKNSQIKINTIKKKQDVFLELYATLDNISDVSKQPSSTLSFIQFFQGAPSKDLMQKISEECNNPNHKIICAALISQDKSGTVIVPH